MKVVLENLNSKDHFISVLCKVDRRTNEFSIKYYNIWTKNYLHTIDNHGVKHAYAGHGISNNNLRKLEIGINDEDILSLKNVINFGEIRAAGISKTRNLPTLMYVLETQGVETFYVVEILKGKKELRFKTMYKNKKIL